MNDVVIEKMELIEAAALQLPQVPVYTTHRFAAGVYMREIVVPADTFIVGHQHRHECLNVLLSGKACVYSDGKVREIEAPFIFKSEAGVRKMAYVREEMRWLTVHHTDETDLVKLEEELIVKSEVFTIHEKLILSKLKARKQCPS